MNTEKMEPVAYEEFEQYWDARWLDTQALRDEYRRTSVVDIARQAFNAGIECSAEAFASQLSAAVAAERERCAKVCDMLAAGTLAGQSGSIDDLSNVMLRQVAVLGHQQCAAAIRQLGDDQ